MTVKWQYKILDENASSSSSYDGFFVKIPEGVAFLYEEQEKYESLVQLNFSNKGRLLSLTKHRVFENDFEDIPIEESLEMTKGIEDCFLFSVDGREYICPGSSSICVSPELDAIVSDDSSLDLKHIYAQHVVNPYHYEEDSFEIDDCVISHKGSFGYQCTSKSTGELMWEKKVKGYLFTEIIKYGEGILFGTAEKGGKLYYIRLSDGFSIFEIETHGTAHFEIKNGYCYCHEKAKQATLLKINLSDGSIEKLQLEGKNGIDCPVRIIDDTLYTLTFEHLNDGQNANPTIYAIQL